MQNPQCLLCLVITKFSFVIFLWSQLPKIILIYLIIFFSLSPVKLVKCWIIYIQSRSKILKDKSHLAAHDVDATTQCYSCGYMKKGDSIAEAIPEIPFCNGKKSSLILPVNQ